MSEADRATLTEWPTPITFHAITFHAMIYTLTLNPAVDRELTVPAIAFDDVLRASSARVDYGGKGFNVSRMLAVLGAESVALGFAGGRSGQLLAEGLAGLGIAADFTWVDGETRTNVSIVAADHSHYVKVNEAGPTISSTELHAMMAKVRALAKAGDWWVMAGSLPPGAPTSMYAEIIEIVEGAGAFAILDSSGDALRLGCEARPTLVKPNASEAVVLVGREVTTTAQVAAVAEAIRVTGVDNVAISLGEEGALLVTESGRWQAVPPAIHERNPIGAGDSMVGGLVWALSQNMSPDEALRWGVACGAATAATGGTGLGTRMEVGVLAGEVEIRRI